MIVVIPKPITDAIFISSSAPENDYPEYNPSATYTIEQRVMVTTGGEHNNYEALSAVPAGKTPKDNGTYWLNLKSNNRWKAFDAYNTSQTAVNGALIMSFRPGVINTLALCEVDGSLVTATLVDGDGNTVWSKSESLQLPNVWGFSDYFFKGYEFKRTLLYNDIPPIIEGLLTVTIYPLVDGYSKCGVLVFGKSEFIGDLETNLGSGEIDYSVQQIDKFGDKYFDQGQYDATLSGVLMVPRSRSDAVDRILHGLRAKPTFWYGDVNLDLAVMFGWRTRYSAKHEVSHSMFTIELQSLN